VRILRGADGWQDVCQDAIGFEAEMATLNQPNAGFDGFNLLIGQIVTRASVTSKSILFGSSRQGALISAIAWGIIHRVHTF